MKLVRNLFRRIKEESTLSPRNLFTRAGVEPRLMYNWKYQQPESWGRWHRMIKAAGIDIPDPGVSTVEALGGYEAAKPHFLNAGYQYNQLNEWYHEGDPRTIENYKKLVFTLNKLPDDLRRSRTENAEAHSDAS